MPSVRKIVGVPMPVPMYVANLVFNRKAAVYMAYGSRRFVDGIFERARRKRDVVARELVVAGKADAVAVGHIVVLALDHGRVRMERHDRVVGQAVAYDESEVESFGAEVEANMKSHIIARENTIVYVDGGSPRIDAYNESIVIVRYGSPDITLHGKAQIIDQTTLVPDKLAA